MKMFNLILNFLFPPRCLACGKLGSYLCPKCQAHISHNKPFICPVCKKPAIDGATHPKCQTKNSPDGFIFFWDYTGLTHKIIHKIKYDPFIFSAIEEIINKHTTLLKNPSFQNILSQNPILVPVPLHPSRLRYRGYNHAEKISTAFAKKWNLKVVNNFLIRTRNTKPQAKLKLEERQKNIKGAFSLNHVSIQPFKQIILVDDVWTTGSTLTECCKVLKQNGARTVWALTMAR